VIGRGRTWLRLRPSGTADQGRRSRSAGVLQQATPGEEGFESAHRHAPFCRTFGTSEGQAMARRRCASANASEKAGAVERRPFATSKAAYFRQAASFFFS
jgi:hypothetical protein